jgi:hypothetical protein
VPTVLQTPAKAGGYKDLSNMLFLKLVPLGFACGYKDFDGIFMLLIAD